MFSIPFIVDLLALSRIGKSSECRFDHKSRTRFKGQVVDRTNSSDGKRIVDYEASIEIGRSINDSFRSIKTIVAINSCLSKMQSQLVSYFLEIDYLLCDKEPDISQRTNLKAEDLSEFALVRSSVYGKLRTMGNYPRKSQLVSLI